MYRVSRLTVIDKCCHPVRCARQWLGEVRLIAGRRTAISRRSSWSSASRSPGNVLRAELRDRRPEGRGNGSGSPSDVFQGVADHLSGQHRHLPVSHRGDPVVVLDEVHRGDRNFDLGLVIHDAQLCQAWWHRGEIEGYEYAIARHAGNAEQRDTLVCGTIRGGWGRVGWNCRGSAPYCWPTDWTWRQEGCGGTAESGTTGCCGGTSPGAPPRPRRNWQRRAVVGRRRVSRSDVSPRRHPWSGSCRCRDGAGEAVCGDDLHRIAQCRARALGGRHAGRGADRRDGGRSVR
jgi:hypothetical protein